MKKILLVSFLVLFTSNLSADVSNNISQYISNLIPGEGDTEVSIDLRENNKPDYSILTVREIEKTENGNFFSQLSLFNTEKDNDERILFFCRGVLETVIKLGWSPDIIHCNDWMSSLVPMLIKSSFSESHLFENTKCIYSVYDNVTLLSQV